MRLPVARRDDGAAVRLRRRLLQRTRNHSGDRSDRVRTYNFPQNRVTDHRLTGEVRSFNLESIINGNLDPLLDALTAMDQARKLAAGEARE